MKQNKIEAIKEVLKIKASYVCKYFASKETTEKIDKIIARYNLQNWSYKYLLHNLRDSNNLIINKAEIFLHSLELLDCGQDITDQINKLRSGAFFYTSESGKNYKLVDGVLYSRSGNKGRFAKVCNNIFQDTVFLGFCVMNF